MFFAPSRALAVRRRKRGGPRIYDARERWALAALDLLLRVSAALLGLKPRQGGPGSAVSPRSVLVLRLDRLGDLVMTLPALAELRRLAPEAEIELVVGSWNEELARGLPFVDRVRVVDAPWAAWGKRVGWLDALRAMRFECPPDLAIDFQGDVRALLLMALSRSRWRAGYGATGGAYLLTHRGDWDESRSWYRQNGELLKIVFAQADLPEKIRPYNFLLPEDRHQGQRILNQVGLVGLPRPWIGIHPSAGRAIKQWEVGKFAALVDRLSEATRGTLLLTGGPADAEIVEGVARRTTAATRRWLSRAGVRVFSAVLERLDVVITGDTGPMHLAHAVGAPNVAVFGPSDPVRYGPEDDTGIRAVVRQSLDCSPCNMIRRPPRECSSREAPECLATVSVEQVVEAVAGLLGKRSGAG